MLWHMLSYLGKGWLETHYSGPTFYFRYPGFEWVPAIPQERSGYGPVEVRAITSISLNARPPQPLVDPEVDLAAQPRRRHAPWIVPLRPRR